MQTKITFKDNGQDFLEWTVSNAGKIVKCEPFQFAIWKKWTVIKPQELKARGFVEITRGNEHMIIKHPIEKIETV